MGLADMFEGFLFKVALKKGVKVAVAVIASAVASAKIAPVLQTAGVHVDLTQMELGMTSAGTAGITMLLNWLKVKTSVGKKYL